MMKNMLKTNSGKASKLLLVILGAAIVFGGTIFYFGKNKVERSISEGSDASALDASAIESIKNNAVKDQVKEIKNLIDEATKQLDELSKSSKPANQ